MQNKPMASVRVWGQELIGTSRMGVARPCSMVSEWSPGRPSGWERGQGKAGHSCCCGWCWPPAGTTAQAVGSGASTWAPCGKSASSKHGGWVPERTPENQLQVVLPFKKMTCLLRFTYNVVHLFTFTWDTIHSLEG